MKGRKGEAGEGRKHKKGAPFKGAPCSSGSLSWIARLVVYSVATGRTLYPDALLFCKLPSFPGRMKYPAQLDVVRVALLNLENPAFITTKKDGTHFSVE